MVNQKRYQSDEIKSVNDVADAYEELGLKTKHTYKKKIILHSSKW